MSGECLLAWHILFIVAENWNAKYITALHQAYSNVLLGFEIFIQ